MLKNTITNTLKLIIHDDYAQHSPLRVKFNIHKNRFIHVYKLKFVVQDTLYGIKRVIP